MEPYSDKVKRRVLLVLSLFALAGFAMGVGDPRRPRALGPTPAPADEPTGPQAVLTAEDATAVNETASDAAAASDVAASDAVAEADESAPPERPKPPKREPTPPPPAPLLEPQPAPVAPPPPPAPAPTPPPAEEELPPF